MAWYRSLRCLARLSVMSVKEATTAECRSAGSSSRQLPASQRLPRWWPSMPKTKPVTASPVRMVRATGCAVAASGAPSASTMHSDSA